jgi:hypothetical protein
MVAAGEANKYEGDPTVNSDDLQPTPHDGANHPANDLEVALTALRPLVCPLVQLRIAVWIDDTRDTRPRPVIRLDLARACRRYTISTRGVSAALHPRRLDPG